MQSKPRAHVFLEKFLEKAGIRKGHQPEYIKELYPVLHRDITDELDQEVPEAHMLEWCKIKTTDGEALQEYIDKYIPDSEDAFTVVYRKFYFMCLRGAVAMIQTGNK